MVPPILVGAAGAGEPEPAVGDGVGAAVGGTTALPPYYFSWVAIKNKGMDLLEGLGSPPDLPPPDNSSDAVSTSSEESPRRRLGALKPTGRRGRGRRRRTKSINSYYY